MGLAWYISAEREVPGLDTFVNGKAIAHAEEMRLAAIMEALGVKPLMEFFSSAPEELADLLGEFEDEAGAVPQLPEEEWFSAAEGLSTVTALLAYLRERRGELEDQDYIVSDLEEYERVLDALAREGVRWHLSIDI